MRHSFTAVALLAAAGMGGACAHGGGPYQRAFESGNVMEAARIFDQDTSLWRDEQALFHTAAARAMPGSPVYDPARAHAELRTFLALFPQSDHRAEALRLEALLGQLQRLADQNRALALRADSLAARTDSLDARADSAGARLTEQRRATFQLQVDLRRTEAELKAVQEELARLKAIDLRLSRRKRG